MSFDELLHYLRLGGVTLALLLLSSLLALGVAIERIITLWGVSERSRALGEIVNKHLLRDLVKKGDADPAAEKPPKPPKAAKAAKAAKTEKAPKAAKAPKKAKKRA